MALTLRELQAYIGAKDVLPDRENGYFLRLVEEVASAAWPISTGSTSSRRCA